MGLGHLRGANEEGAEQRAAGAADVGEQRHAGVFEDKANIFIGNRRQLFDHFTETAVHIETVVGVANLFIEAGEKSLSLVKISPQRYSQSTICVLFSDMSCSLVSPVQRRGVNRGVP